MNAGGTDVVEAAASAGALDTATATRAARLLSDHAPTDGAAAARLLVEAGLLTPAQAARALADAERRRARSVPNPTPATDADATLCAPGALRPSTVAVAPATDRSPASGGGIPPDSDRWDPDDTAQRIQPGGAAVGRYAMHGELGRGGMGAVWRAFDADARRDVAFKVLLDPNPTAEATARFLAEAQITAQLEHPSIVPVHEVARDADGRLYFTMKLVRGRSLKVALASLEADLRDGRGDGRLPLRSRLEIFKKICDALAFAHSRNVIHRDLKPENVMLGEFGEVQVMDWGLAKIVDPADPAQAGTPASPDDPRVATDRDDLDLARTVDGAVAGTPAYMSPEQAAGDVARITTQSDIYALGGLLYELLTCTPPFQGTNVMQVLLGVAQGELEPPSRRVLAEFGPGRQPTVPSELEAVVLKAMAHRPLDRYRTAGELHADVDRFLEGRALAAVRYAPWQLWGKWFRRNRVAAIGGLTTLAAVVVGIALAIVVSRRSHAAARLAEIQRQLAPHQAALERAATASQAIGAAIAARDWPRAIAASARARDELTPALAATASSDAVRAERPDWAVHASTHSAQLRALRIQAVMGHATERIAALGSAIDLEGADREPAAAEAFAALRALSDEPGLEGLPTAEAALWLARRHAERTARAAPSSPDASAHDSECRRWIASAWAAQPGSPAATRAIWLLAERTAEPREAVTQLHLALSAIGETQPAAPELAALWAETLLRLTAQLALLDPGAPPPFASNLTTPELALRHVLRVVGPDGRLRPGLALALGADATSIERDFADWLSYLRTTSAWSATSVGVLRRGASIAESLYYALDPRTGRMDVLTAQPPATPGYSPCRFTPLQSIDLLAIGRASDPDLPANAHIQVFPYGTDGRFAVGMNDVERRSLVVVLFASGEHPDVVARTQVRGDPTLPSPLDMIVMAAGDLDGDGADDVLITDQVGGRSISILRVLLQDPGGSFAAPQLLMRPEDAGSLYSTIVIDDLDGDGGNELLLCRGAWNHFCLDVLRIGRDRALPAGIVAREHCAPTTLVQLGRGPDHALVIVSGLTPELRRFFAIRHLPEPFWGCSAWRFDGRAFTALEAPRYQLGAAEPDYRPKEGFDTLCGPIALEEGQVALAVGRRWLLFDGPPTERPLRRALRIAPAGDGRGDGLGNLAGGGRVLLRGHRLCRPLTDADLDVIASLPLGTRPATTGIASVEKARRLMDFGLPREAARLARAVLDGEPRGRDETVALTHLELSGLAEVSACDELLTRIRALRPDAELAAVVRDALDVAALKSRRYGDVLALLTAWIDSASLTAAQRELFRTDAARMASSVGLVGEPAIDVRGTAIRVRGEAEPRAWADHIVQSAHQTLTLVKDPQAGSVEWLLRSCPVVAQARVPDTAGDPVVLREHGTDWVGVPVAFAGGSARVVCDVRGDLIAAHGIFHIGLVELDGVSDMPPSPGWWLEVMGSGSNDMYAYRIAGRQLDFAADRLRDRWLRIDFEVDAHTRQHRLVVFDVESKEVLAHRRGIGSVPTGGCFLLGIRAYSHRDLVHAITEVRMRRLACWGDVQLLAPGDARVRRWSDVVGAANPTAALRATVLGDQPAVAAALRREADRLHAAASALAPSDPRRAYVAMDAVFARLDAEAAAGVQGLPDRLALLMGTDGDVEIILRWLVARPQTDPATDELWRAVEHAVAIWRSGGVDPRSRVAELRAAALADATEASRIRAASLLLGLWLYGERPDDREVASYALSSLLQAAQARPGASCDVLGNRFCRYVAKLSPDDQRGVQALTLPFHARLLRRDVVLRIVRELNEPAEYEDVRRATAELDELRRASQAAALAQAHREPVAFAALPGD